MKPLKWFQVLNVSLVLGFFGGKKLYSRSLAMPISNWLMRHRQRWVAKKGGKLTIALSWTNPQGKAIVEEFQKIFLL